MPLFAGTILLGAFLLFAMQPMVGKMLLPRLGGSPAVWNTCMVFFQVMLLAGYAYAHFLPKWIGERRHAVVHVVVMALPFLVLPMALRGAVPPVEGNPVGWVLVTLALTAGLPFFVVSTSGPLLQKWYAATTARDAGDPYFLYAASNAGSLIALVAYPFVIEPWLGVARQAWWWMVLYGGLVALTVACVAMWWRAPRHEELSAVTDESVTSRQRWWWILLAFVPSSYLLGVTTFISTNIAAVPLLWVVPLALYLLSFIFVFARRQVVPHRAMVLALPWVCLAAVVLMLLRVGEPLSLVLGVHLAGLFVVAMVCHGELARTRPGAARLTEFYLMLAIGGALGGVFNALVAPLLFTQPLEYPLAIVLACWLWPTKNIPTRWGLPVDVLLGAGAGVCAWIAVAMNRQRVTQMEQAVLILVLLAAAGLACAAFAYMQRPQRFAIGVAGLLAVYAFMPIDRTRQFDARRSFFGVHRIAENGDGQFVELYHSATLHGRQRLDALSRPAAPHTALAYYHQSGPIGQLLTSLPPERKQKIAVVGLGVGSLGAYARYDTQLTFYEIDPVVRWAAEESGRFNYLASARERGANVNVALGDARLTLAQAPPHSYDLIVLDAFSGDSIPVHLLTREAGAIYFDKLKPGGLLAIHMSNSYLRLEPVIANLARDQGCVCLAQTDTAEDGNRLADGALPSQWAVMSRAGEALAGLRDSPLWQEAKTDASVGLWTDDFSNVMQVLGWWERPK